jgi:glycosyltransferase involved in cell wall biosynthesis
MNNNPFFSVIIPVYNRKDFISKSIKSVLAQSYTNFEIICINDSSSDGTKQMIIDHQMDDNRVKLISLEQNRGRCIARNEGIKNARGGWICFLDSDDVYLTNHLKTLFDLIKANKTFKAFATNQIINNKQNKLQNSVLTLSNFITTNPIQINQLCLNRDIGIYFPNERIPISEDWYFFRKITSSFPIFYSSVVTCQLIAHNDRSVNSTVCLEFAKWNEYTGELFANQADNKIKNKILPFTYLLCANILLTKNHRKESYLYLKKAFKYPQSLTEPLLYKALAKLLVFTKRS